MKSKCFWKCARRKKKKSGQRQNNLMLVVEDAEYRTPPFEAVLFTIKLENYENNLATRLAHPNLLVMPSGSTNWWNHFGKAFQLRKTVKKKSSPNPNHLKFLKRSLIQFECGVVCVCFCETAKIIQNRCRLRADSAYNCCNDREREVHDAVFRHHMHQPI